MEFQQYKSAKLSHLVESIYERKVGKLARVQFLPDGVITLIFNLGSATTTVKGEAIDTKVFNPVEKFCFISGLHTRPLYFNFENLHVVGIILRPAAVKAFFNIPAEEFKDVAIEGLFIKDLSLIEDKLKGMQSFQERAHWLEDHFFSLFRASEDLEMANKLQQTMWIMKNDVLSGKRLNIAAYSGYSRMHTTRIFKEWFGLTPTKMLKYEQFLHSLQLLHNENLSLTQVAVECGFYDQAHFIRVFSEFAKMTPGQYKKRMGFKAGVLPW